MPEYGAISAEVARELTGIEFFEGIIAGRLPHPPVAKIMNGHITEVSHGYIVWEGAPPANFINPMGGVHGGWVMSVLDSALACAVHCALDRGKYCLTLEAKINLTRAPVPGKPYRAVGQLITVGRRTGTSEARLYDQDGKVVAFGTTTCMILDV